MGQQDDKIAVASTKESSAPQQELQEEPKETDKMLVADENAKSEKAPAPAPESSSTEQTTSAAGAKTTAKVDNEEVAIDIPTEEQTENEGKVNKKEEREVKPRKIPIGGFKLPGFFTKSKQPKADADGADGELLKAEQKEEPVLTVGEEGHTVDIEAAKATAAEEINAEGGGDGGDHVVEITSKAPRLGLGARFRNIFTRERKEETPQQEADEEQVEPPEQIIANGGSGEADAKSEATAEAAASTGDVNETNNADESTVVYAETTVNNTQRSLRERLSAFKLPFPQFVSRKKQQAQDIELGLTTKAGLASMETLDDSLKDQDCVDRANSATKTNGNADEHTKQPTAAATQEEAKNENANGDAAAPATNTEGGAEKTEEANANNQRSSRFSFFSWSAWGIDETVITGLFCLIVLLVGCLCFVFYTHNPFFKPIELRDGRYVTAVTSCGLVEGVLEDNAFAFRGIPYALPPIDDRRWRYSQEISGIDDCWNGTLLAHNTSQLCSQRNELGEIIGNEDCLYLDVVTSHIHNKRLPVIVLIGADTLTGPSPGILRPSASYAHSRDVVFVRPNFRLGPFGFLALDALTKEAHPHSSGNYALSDIIAALKWVKTNIKNFGGDPDSVTLVGHRAGATLVSALATSREAESLFARAWASSPSAIFPGKSLAESEQKNKEFLQTLKCHDLECLRDLAEQSVWAATPNEWIYEQRDLPRRNESAANHHEWLVLDGQILREHPSAVWKKSEQASNLRPQAEPIPRPKLVIGTTAHELNTPALYKRQNWTAADVRRFLEESTIGDFKLTDEVIARYNATDYRSLITIISDIRSICPLLLNARQQQSVPFYVVTQGAGSEQLASVGDDIQAILGRYDSPTTEQRRYTSAMQQLFYYYIAHGTMPEYNSRRRVLHVGQDTLSYEEHPHCNYWISKDFVPRYARPE